MGRRESLRQTRLPLVWLLPTQTVSDLNEEISNKILRYLAKMKRDFPEKPSVYRETMLKDLRLDDATLDFYVKLLSDQYLVYVQTPLPYSPWTHANITATGARQAEST